MERFFKIHPSVISVAAKNRVLKDKEQKYSESNFDDADELVKKGFLVEVFETKAAPVKKK